MAFGRTAEVIGEYCRKGSQVCVEGRLQTRSYRDREDQKRWTTEVIAQRVQLLGRPEDKRAPEAGDEGPSPAEPPEQGAGTDDDIPY